MPKGPKGKSRKRVPVGTVREPPGTAKPKRRLTAKEKEERKAADWQLFVRQAGRKAQRGREPNDRLHSNEDDTSLRRMRPQDFDRLIRHGEED